MGDKRSLIVPSLVVALGTAWLISTLGIAPEINWIWTIGIAIVGVLSFALSGVDKVTVVIGPMFIAASLLSILRQTGRLKLDTEVPILVILAGVLLFIARMPAIPVPAWFIPGKNTDED